MAAQKVLYDALLPTIDVTKLVSMASVPSWAILPNATIAWVLTVVVGSYVGTDRLAMFVKSRDILPPGAVDYGDPKKLRRIIYLMLGLAAEAGILQVFYHVPGLAFETLMLAAGGAISTYVVGQKAISVTEHMGAGVSQPQVVAGQIPGMPTVPQAAPVAPGAVAGSPVAHGLGM